MTQGYGSAFLLFSRYLRCRIISAITFMPGWNTRKLISLQSVLGLYVFGYVENSFRYESRKAFTGCSCSLKPLMGDILRVNMLLNGVLVSCRETFKCCCGA